MCAHWYLLKCLARGLFWLTLKYPNIATGIHPFLPENDQLQGWTSSDVTPESVTHPWGWFSGCRGVPSAATTKDLAGSRPRRTGGFTDRLQILQSGVAHLCSSCCLGCRSQDFAQASCAAGWAAFSAHLRCHVFGWRWLGLKREFRWSFIMRSQSCPKDILINSRKKPLAA